MVCSNPCSSGIVGRHDDTSRASELLETNRARLSKSTAQTPAPGDEVSLSLEIHADIMALPAMRRKGICRCIS
jgi:hypothetical protein